MNVATAYVELRAKRDKLKADLDGVEKDTRTKADSISKTFASIFAATAFGAGIKKSIDAASDLNETVSKTKQLFGDDAEAVIAFGKTTAQSMGLSQRAYLDAAAGLKGLLDNLGLAPEQATEWSQKLTQLGSDLGSFFNKDPAEAVAAIGSAMRGESEPIRAFNVQINEAAIKAKALELGLYSGVGAIDSNAKAQATLALIMEQTTAAQGDFARTADGAANSQRIAKATMEDSAASLGQAFLPIYTKIVQLVTAVGKGFGELPVPIQLAIVALVGLVALSGPIKGTSDLVKTMSVNIKALGISGSSAAIALGALGLVIIAATGWYSANADKKAKLVGITDDFVAALNAEKQGQKGAVDAAVAKGLSDQKLIDAAKTLGLSVSDLADIVNGKQVPAYQKLQQVAADNGFTMDHLVQNSKTLGTSTDDLAQRNDDLRVAFGYVNGVLAPLNDGLANAKDQMATTADVAKTLAAAAEDERHGLDRARGGAVDAKGATDDLAAATAEATRKSGVYSDALQTQLDKLAQLYPAQYDAVKAKYDYADAQAATMVAADKLNTVLKDHKSTQEDVTSATNSARDAIIGQSEKFAGLDGAASGSEGAIRRQIQSLTDQAASLAPGSPLRLYIDQYIADLANIPSNVSTILALHVSADATNAGAAGYLPRFGGAGATGIETRLGSYYRVGEGGKPEMYTENGQNYLIPGDNGQVTPFGQASAASSGSPVQIIIYGAERSYVMELARQIDNIRREGR